MKKGPVNKSDTGDQQVGPDGQQVGPGSQHGPNDQLVGGGR